MEASAFHVSGNVDAEALYALELEGRDPTRQSERPFQHELFGDIDDDTDESELFTPSTISFATDDENFSTATTFVGDSTEPDRESDGSGTSSKTSPGVDSKSYSLLDLPAEIRLQIYKWACLGSPVEQEQLTPWHPASTHTAYFLRAVLPEVRPGFLSVTELTAISDRPSPPQRTDKHHEQQPGILSPLGTLTCIPSALLRACKTTYHECRTLPFQENEFVFVNWFSSGLTAAVAFLQALQHWQRQELRWVRLELHAADLSGAEISEWRLFCAYLASSLRGLRLKIVIGGGVYVPGFEDLGPTGRLPRACGRVEPAELLVASPSCWIDQGLCALSRLEQLELEITGSELSKADKVAWCDDISGRLNTIRQHVDEIKVVCVERALKTRT